ncbi:MAG: hypothetical protein HOP29_19310 [Phycisphaerales bacterium]|nr:hypothetical protein [Phycisphaerales bacterium]
MPSRTQSPETPDFVWITAAVAACAPILAMSLFAALARTDDIDAYLFAYYGKRLLAGQRLYADLWDNKPPGIFWADAVGLWLAGGRFLGIIVVCALASIGSCAAFFLTARRLYGVPAAAVGVVMAAVYVFQHDYHVGSNRPSTLFVCFELCAMGCYVHAFGGTGLRRARLFGAGVCMAAAVFCQQTAFSSVGAIMVHQLVLTLSRAQKAPDAARNLCAVASGAVTATFVVLVALLITSDFRHAWFGIVSSNLGYFARPGKSELLPAFFRWEVHLDILGLPLVLATASVVHGLAAMKTRRSMESNAAAGSRAGIPMAIVLVGTWFPIALYTALIGPSKRMTYFAVALAPLVLLATHAVWLLFRAMQRVERPRIGSIIAVLWFVFMMVPAIAFQWRSAQIAFFRRFDDRSTIRGFETAEVIRRHTRADESVYMLGYLPPVYWYADRPLAQRYLVSTLIDQWMERAQPVVDEVIADLKRDPPTVLVIGRDEMKFIEQPPADHPVRYGDLPSWIRSHYRVAPDALENEVWIRDR